MHVVSLAPAEILSSDATSAAHSEQRCDQRSACPVPQHTYRFRCCAVSGTHFLDRFHDIHSLGDFTKDHVLTVLRIPRNSDKSDQQRDAAARNTAGTVPDTRAPINAPLQSQLPRQTLWQCWADIVNSIITAVQLPNTSKCYTHQMVAHFSAKEELGAVGVRASVSHGQDACARNHMGQCLSSVPAPVCFNVKFSSANFSP